MKKDMRFQINTNIVLREETDDWALLFNPDSGDVVGINPVGVVIWRCLEKQRSLIQIVSEVTSTFQDIPNTAAEEIFAFIEGLKKRGFLAEVIFE